MSHSGSFIPIIDGPVFLATKFPGHSKEGLPPVMGGCHPPRYRSTRGGATGLSFEQAVFEGNILGDVVWGEECFGSWVFGCFGSGFCVKVTFFFPFFFFFRLEPEGFCNVHVLFFLGWFHKD